jgi:hypothetical protein
VFSPRNYLDGLDGEQNIQVINKYNARQFTV